MFWIGLISVVALVTFGILLRWTRGVSVVELVRDPPPEVDLPEIVTILSYMHHELVKHRLPVVRTVASRPLDRVEEADVEVLKQVVTGHGGRPSVVYELDGYLSGLRRAAGQIHLNTWRDPLMRRARKAFRTIQEVTDGLGARTKLTRREHLRLREADQLLDSWFRPRLQALRSSVLLLELSDDVVEMSVARARQEVGAAEAAVELPRIEPGLAVRMLRADFEVVLRNLVRNALRASADDAESKVAIEVTSRVELTGEESVLLRVYDTAPRVLSREELYGGELGRGLNLVTTTLRRYDGALSCRPSKREGFAKYLEVRLFRAMAEDSGAELLDGRSHRERLVPTLSLGVLFLTSAVAASGLAGWIPDPIALGTEYLRAQPTVVAPVATRDVGFLRERRLDAVGAAVTGISLAALDAVEDANARSVQVPPPSAIHADGLRCSHERMPQSRRVNVTCRLVRTRPTAELFAPVLVLGVDEPYDLAGLRTVSHEMLRVGEEIREASAEQSCVVATAVPRGGQLPEGVAEMLKQPEAPDSPSRLVVDYRACLFVPRYPIRVILKVERNTADPSEGVDPNLSPVTIDLQVKLRELGEAQRAYTGISNQTSVIEQRQDRRRFVRAMAREVASELTRTFPPGTMSSGAQRDLAQALYFGWIRPSVYEAIDARVAQESAQPTIADDEFCRLDVQAAEGVALLEELKLKTGRNSLFRSIYYAELTKLWVRADLPASRTALDAFQRDHGDETDFAQGARFTFAMMIALGSPPSPRERSGLAAALKPATDGDVGSPVLGHLVALLMRLKAAADRPPRKGRDVAYERIKLMGLRTIAEDEVLDEGVSVADALCGFREVNRGWVQAMAATDAEQLFGHCPGFERVRSILEGPDAGADEGIVVNDAPMTKSIRLAQTYVEKVQRLLSRPAHPCPPRAPSP